MHDRDGQVIFTRGCGCHPDYHELGVHAPGFGVAGVRSSVDARAQGSGGASPFLRSA